MSYWVEYVFPSKPHETRYVAFESALLRALHVIQVGTLGATIKRQGERP